MSLKRDIVQSGTGIDNQSKESSGAAKVARPDAFTRRSHRSRRRSQSERKARRLTYGLLIGLGAVLFGIILSFYVGRISNETERAVFELRKKERELANAQLELEQLRTERDALVQGRIHGLRLLGYDEAVAISEKYVRNIIFTLAGKGDDIEHEYRMVMHNDGLSSVFPDVRMLMFDEHGIQVGMAEVNVSEDDKATGAGALKPGEIRSYTGTLSMIRDAQPSYFQLAIR